ncbi:MAG TPA: HAMP domain-containing sensor histidine kinase [Candidatus Sumerlaeota bacterium]|nr:HAMP domain-containing sensor histidine kinase [Candidatus Sumerlaeota bacterium]
MGSSCIDTRSVLAFLSERRAEFLKTWVRLAREALQSERGGGEDAPGEVDEEHLELLFDNYVLSTSSQGEYGEEVMELTCRKFEEGLRLSGLFLLNSTFLTTVRRLLREQYPGAFETRVGYLEALSQRMLGDEISLARLYEAHLRVLNDQIQEKAETLKLQNDTLVKYVDIATHELQAPLWSILGFSSKLQRLWAGRVDETTRHCLERISANVSEMHTLISDVTQMLTLDAEKMLRRDVFLPELIEEAFDRIQREVDSLFECDFSGCAGVVLVGDRTMLRDLVIHLLRNAAQYVRSGEHGVLRVCAEERPLGAGTPELHLTFVDRGIGVALPYRELVFRPMERLKENEVAGSGMGLTLSRRIVEMHGGAIELEGGRDGGLCVRIRWPKTAFRWG